MAVSAMRNEKYAIGRIVYELGYGVDTMFHRTYFLFRLFLPRSFLELAFLFISFA